ncbi:MAG: biotin/lipoyl-binding protein [Saprospiraceae bacterium]|nr:biotin/lipoyl-binding protein [Saprospiraceae bacterium]MDW8484789.1 biotin/lipoyl-containing protein [Saprospiraceae bacterium]
MTQIPSKNEPFQISVNNQYQLEVLPAEAMALDVVADGKDAFHVLKDGRAFRIEVVSAHYEERRFVFRIDGNLYNVYIADFYARLLQQLGMHARGSYRSNTIKAPMPGLVLQVLVQPGQSVKKGEPVLILEAMKMENVLKATSEGIVKEVAVHNGQAVDKGATLVTLQ